MNQKSKIRRRPKLGQHFLSDRQYRTRIIEALDQRTDEVVIEIGPGRGAMTPLLAQRARKVIAIEIDCALAHELEQDLRDLPRVRIVPADVLGIDFAALCRDEGTTQVFVFGNLPYYITSPILHHLFAQRDSIRAMGLLMQREVAERLVAPPGGRAYGYLTVAAQIYSRPEIAVAVPPGAFSPAPKVHSSLVTFRMAPQFPGWSREKCEEFLEFVKRCFAQKRKNLLNNLAGSYSRGRLLEALDAVGKNQKVRAEQLSLEDLAGVCENLMGSSIR